MEGNREYKTPEDLLADPSFQRYCLGTDPKAAEQWHTWIGEHPEHGSIVMEAETLYRLLNGQNSREEFERDYRLFTAKTQKKVPELHPESKPVGRILPWKRWYHAAAILLVAIFGASLFQHLADQSQSVKEIAGKTKRKSEIRPGGNRATLTLADGSTVALDSVATGIVSIQGSLRIIKEGDGALIYELANGRTDGKPAYNIITTPKGGQYQVVLSDGTKVWLNAASSLKYPSAFARGERRVELEGEGYFEVAHNDSKPFIVTAGPMQVEVLGTAFNINNYADEDGVRTTLVKGSVRVSAGPQTISLVPGSQAEWEYRAQKINIKKGIDIAAVTAWKNGYFDLNGLSLQEMMRQISRWYDVDVKYVGAVPSFEFGGKIQRSLPISSVIEILKMSNVNAYVDNGNVIIIKP